MTRHPGRSMTALTPQASLRHCEVPESGPIPHPDLARRLRHCERSAAAHDFQQPGLPRYARSDNHSARSDEPKHPAPLLVLAWGNLSRGDDALGPLCLAGLRMQLPDGLQDQVEFLEDYQLQVEHALDLMERKKVLFIDASLNCLAPFQVTQLEPARDASFTTHALSPQALLQVYQDLQGAPPPPCTLLAIRGEQFELGAAPSPAALAHLASALSWAGQWLLDAR